MASRVFRAYAIFKYEDSTRIEICVGPFETSKEAYNAILDRCSSVIGRIGTDGCKLVNSNIYESVAKDSVRLADYGWFLEDAIHNKLFAKGKNAEQGDNQ